MTQEQPKEKAPVRKKKKAHRSVSRGQAHISATYNNTIITMTDAQGNVLAWGSAGKSGFHGPKKATPFAAGVIIRSLADRIREVGLREVDVRIKGVGSGRESAVRALAALGVSILSIKDVTPIAHNGVRPPRPRRV